MRPVPVVFHLGPLQIHTYGIGLALTFWFGYRYTVARLRRRGYPVDWVAGTFIWVVIASVIGARTVHVLAHLSYYTQQPGQIVAVWNGGLTSFGGLLAAVPVGLASAHRRCPSLRLVAGLDLIAPVLIASWALGRVLGPQFMIAGGGRPTDQWFGMYYAGQVGRRIPVPLIQAVECAAILVVVLLIERALARGTPAPGLVAAVAFSLWGLTRFFDEYLWLTYDVGTDAIEVSGLVMFALGGALAARTLRRRHRSTPPRGEPA